MPIPASGSPGSEPTTGADSHELTLRPGGIQDPALGDALPLSVQPEHIQLFDKDSGQRI